VQDVQGATRDCRIVLSIPEQQLCTAAQAASGLHHRALPVGPVQEHKCHATTHASPCAPGGCKTRVHHTKRHIPYAAGTWPLPRHNMLPSRPDGPAVLGTLRYPRAGLLGKVEKIVLRPAAKRSPPTASTDRPATCGMYTSVGTAPNHGAAQLLARCTEACWVQQ
jgi:hypothetical protein